MGVCIITLLVSVIGIIIIVLENKIVMKRGKNLIAEACGAVGRVVLGTGFCLTLILGACACGVAAEVSIGTEYQNMLFERETIVYRIDKEKENIVGNELLYNDIVEFNNKVRAEKNGVDNWWISWFFNKDIAKIEYIELPNEEQEK